MNFDGDAVILKTGANEKSCTIPKVKDEFHVAAFTQLPALPGIGEGSQESLGVFTGQGVIVEGFWLAVQHQNGLLADVRLQFIRAIGMNEVKEIVQRIHTWQGSTIGR